MEVFILGWFLVSSIALGNFEMKEMVLLQQKTFFVVLKQWYRNKMLRP